MGIKEYSDTLQKKYKDSFITLASSEKLNIERISTGSLTLDDALGGGLPKGKMSLFWGHEMSGKTTLSLLCLKNSKRGVYIDAESSFDPAWAKKLGLNLDEVVVAKPGSGERAFDLALKFMEDEFDVVIIDSIASLVPSQELAKDIFDSPPIASQARLVNLAVRRLNLANKNTALILVNQVREKIGVMYGSPETMPGGQAVRFTPQVRLRFRRGGWLDEGGKRVGIEVRIMIEKNKYGESQRDIHFNLYWKGYIDFFEEKVRLLLDKGEIEQDGSWYHYKGKKYHGVEEVKKAVEKTNSKA